MGQAELKRTNQTNKKNKSSKTITRHNHDGTILRPRLEKIGNLQQIILVDMAVSGDLNRNEIRKIEPALYGVDLLYKEL